MTSLLRCEIPNPQDDAVPETGGSRDTPEDQDDVSNVPGPPEQRDAPVPGHTRRDAPVSGHAEATHEEVSPNLNAQSDSCPSDHVHSESLIIDGLMRMCEQFVGGTVSEPDVRSSDRAFPEETTAERADEAGPIHNPDEPGQPAVGPQLGKAAEKEQEPLDPLESDGSHQDEQDRHAS